MKPRPSLILLAALSLGTAAPAAAQSAKVALREVFVGPTEAYKLVGMLGTPDGLFVTLSNVYRGAHESRIYLDGRLVYRGTQETVGQPFLWKGKVFFPVEHGANALVWSQGAIRLAAATAGRWSVAGGVVDGRPVLTYNDQYVNRAFLDKPLVVDAITGAPLFSFDAKAMVRKIVTYGGEPWASVNFGENLLVSRSGRRVRVDTVHIEVYRGVLYGGGGSRWGPVATPATANGIVSRFNGKRMVPLVDTGCSSIQHMAVLQGELWIAGTDPDRLFVVRRNGRIKRVAEVRGETSADGGRSFGGAVALHRGQIYWGRSDLQRGRVYRLEQLPNLADTTPPSLPKRLRARARSASRISLTWRPAQDRQSGIQRYRVYRDGKLVGRVSDTAYVDRGLRASRTYGYEVEAINRVNLASGRSAPAAATTLPSQP
jgi:hypothetical protein